MGDPREFNREAVLTNRFAAFIASLKDASKCCFLFDLLVPDPG